MSNRFVSLILSCLFSVLLVPVAFAQEQAPDTAMKILRKDHGTYFIINDPLPAVRSVLSSPRLAKALTSGRTGEMIKRQNKAPVDPKQWLQQVEENQRWVPDQIVLAMTDDGMAQCGNFVNLFLLGGLSHASGLAEDVNTAGAVQPPLLEVMKDFRMPAITLFVRFREAEDAAGLFAMGRAQVAPFAEDFPWLKMTDGAIVMDAGSEHFIDDADIMREVVSEMLGIADPESAIARSLAEAAMKLRLKAQVEVIGRGIRVTLGEPSSAPAMDAIDPFLSAQADALLVGGWNVKPLLERYAAASAIWDQHRASPAAKKLQEIDTDGLLVDFETNAAWLKSVADAGLCFASPADDGMRMTARTTLVAPAADARQSPLLKLIPSDCPIWALDTTMSMADMIGGQLVRAEGRAEIKSIGAEIAPTKQNLQMAETLEKYYAHFQPFRKAILTEMPALHEPSSLFLMDTRGKIESLEFAASDVLKMKLVDMRVPEIAVAGRVKDKDKALENARSVIERFADGFYGAQGTPRDPAIAAVAQRDLGLGVPTFVATRAWIDPLVKDSPIKTWTLTGDAEIHFFLTGDVLVMSTSPRLSREMLKPRAQPVTLPQAKDKLVSAGVVPGEALALVTETTGDLMREIAKLSPRPRNAADPMELFGALGDFVRNMDRIDWQSTDDATYRRTDVRVIFHDVK